MPKIHPTAVVAPEARLGEGVEIGPHCVIGPEVSLGDGTRLINNVTVDGRTSIGRGCTLYTGVCIGFPPQVKGRTFETPSVRIGNDNVLREHTTVHGASKPEGATVIGDRNYLMVNTHVAHDCILGNDIVMANAVVLGGHVTIEDGAVLGGVAGVHQFVRVGRLVMLGAYTKLVTDAAPYSIVDGNPAAFYGANVVGLRRAGFKPEEVRAVRRALITLLGTGRNLSLAQQEVRADSGQYETVRHILDFVSTSKRGVVRGASGPDESPAAVEETV